MKRILRLVFAVLICADAACQGPSVTHINPGVYKIVCTDSGGMSTSDLKARTLRNEAIHEAKTFAESQGKVAVPLYGAERHVVDASIFGYGQAGTQNTASGMNVVTFDYFFGVVDKSDLRAQIPMTLVREPGERRADPSTPGGYTVFFHAEPVR
jgi:hypothetical protein